MKPMLAWAIALALPLAVASLAQAQGMGGMDMKGMDKKDMQGMDMKSDKAGKKGKAQTHKGSGTVTKVDAQKGNVTIAHGPVQSMNWPAMTMTFKVKDKSALGKVKQGDKIDFNFVESGKDYTITEMK